MSLFFFFSLNREKKEKIKCALKKYSKFKPFERKRYFPFLFHFLCIKLNKKCIK